MFNVPERYRVKRGAYASDVSYGNNGIFVIPSFGGSRRVHYQCIACDGTHELSKIMFGDVQWEHVSVVVINISHSGKTTHEQRCPTWEEMCKIKELFWEDPEAVVLQFHPPKSEYVSQHPHCLHLWRPVKDGQAVAIPRPPMEMVGMKPKAHDVKQPDESPDKLEKFKASIGKQFSVGELKTVIEYVNTEKKMIGSPYGEFALHVCELVEEQTTPSE
jgi:hypothetical protein